MNKQTKYYLIAGITMSVSLMVILVLALVVVPLKKQKLAIEEAQRKELEKEMKFDACMNDAWENYILSWDKQCEGLGLEADCRLPSKIASSTNKNLDDAEKICTQMYD